ncbi:class I SAM-dependent methyltransferase [Methylobacterium sp. J-090]|uniref:class I SAM-dependent methyltransferase n=1 Tax=Methylobacterium sp. J-090 TaxID=2836666 RepID=UPI001FBA63A8|nr:methyltransferase domain-containing protein [Methylobacterium sp. J-090]MCJ2082225.1 methyltransferase domain-containing protein [Methylobacterium sp. J-090]
MAASDLTQGEYWNGDAGARWARHQATFDRVFTPLTERLFARAALRPGDAVLDVGCGAGATTLRAADAVGPSGRVTAADVSAPLLAVTARRAQARPPGGAPIALVEADAQTHPFTDGAFAHLISRFGIMFFDDSTAAFANLHRALRPGGRLTVLCWRPLVENAWIAEPLGLIRALVPEPEPTPPDAPGPFRFAEAERLRAVLAAAGFGEIGFETVDEELVLGRSETGSARAAAEAAAAFALDLGPASRLVRDQPPTIRERALDLVLRDFEGRAVDGTVRLGAACWLVTATR